MIFHRGYYDYPLDGLAEYNGQDVYFTIANYPTVLQPPYPQEVIDALESVVVDDDLDIDLTEYWIYYDERLIVEHKLSYYLYKVPIHIIKEYKHEFMVWSDHIGWHCWHDEHYRPMIVVHPDPSFNKDIFYQSRKEKYVNMDIKDFELIGQFGYDQFQNFSRPF